MIDIKDRKKISIVILALSSLVALLPFKLGPHYVFSFSIFSFLIPIALFSSLNFIFFLLAFIFLAVLFYPINIENASIIPWFLIFVSGVGVVSYISKKGKPIKADSFLLVLLIFSLYELFVDIFNILFHGLPSQQHFSFSNVILSIVLKPLFRFLLVATIANIPWEEVPNKTKKKFEGFILICAVLAFLFAFFQYVPQKPSVLVPLLDYYISEDRLIYYIELPMQGYHPRVMGPFGNDNQMGVFSGLMMLFIFFLFKKRKGNIRDKLLIFLLFLMAFASLMLTQSLTAFFGIIISFLFIVAFFSFRKSSKRLINFIYLMAIGISLVPVFVFPSIFYRVHYVGEKGLGVETLVTRQQIWRFLVDNTFSDPVSIAIGKGIFFLMDPEIHEKILGAADNEFVRVLVAYGTIGLLLFLLVFIAFLRLAKVILPPIAPAKEFVLGGLLFFLIACFTGEYFSANKIGLLFLFILSFVLYSEASTTSRTR
jgi:hypothetical protein